MEPITEREAARRLAAVRGLSLSASQHLLATGVVGRPATSGRMKLYDATRVDALLELPPVRADEFVQLFPDGVIIVRLPRSRTIDASMVWPETRDVLAGPWRPGSRQKAAIWLGTLRDRSVPLLLTVSAHVVAGARVADPRPGGDGVTFELQAPGRWLDQVVGRRVRGHRGPQVELVNFTPPRRR